MKFNQLNLTKSKSKRRVGRGIAAGRGKTAGRGTKGQKSRSGSGGRPYFEGGQTPLVRKLPKLPGFKSLQPPVQVVYTGQLDDLKPAKIINNQVLKEAHLIKDIYQKVKLIKKGEIKNKHHLEIQGISKAAQELLESAGGTFKKIKRLQRPKSSNKKSRKFKKSQAKKSI